MDGKFDLIVVGNGISADIFLFLLSQKVNKKFRVLQMASSDIYPSCSRYSTSYVSLNGVRPGVSELGDRIYNSYGALIEFMNEFPCEGIYPGTHYFLPLESEKEDFKRRFCTIEKLDWPRNILGPSDFLWGKKWPAFLFDYMVFSKWIKKEIQEKITIETVEETLVSLLHRDSLIQTLSGKNYSYHKILLCTGAYSKFMTQGLPTCQPLIDLNQSKIVPGNFLFAKNIDLGPKSFIISRDFCNLVYRSFDGTLMFGGTTNKEEIIATDFSSLMRQYRDLSQLLINPPPWDHFEIKTGNRHKGKKRRPFWGEIYFDNENKSCVLANWGHYKNGFSYTFLAGKELVQKYFK